MLLRRLSATALLVGFYLLLAQSVAPVEMAVAFASAGLGVWSGRALVEQLRISFKLSWKSVRLIALTPAQIVNDTILLIGRLPRLLRHRDGPIGSFVKLSHERPSPDSSIARAAKILGLSLPPNTFVARIEPDNWEITLHELFHQAAP